MLHYCPVKNEVDPLKAMFGNGFYDFLGGFDLNAARNLEGAFDVLAI